MDLPDLCWDRRILHLSRRDLGHSLVIDPAGRLWRARSYEDFVTAYTLSSGTWEIDKLTPLYSQMREYR